MLLPRNLFKTLLGAALFCAACLPFAVPAKAFSAEEPSGKSPRLLVHLLDYLAADYSGAVKDGKILSQGEYQEQLEFSKTVLDLSLTLPEFRSESEIQAQIKELDSLIHSKADAEKVAGLARQIQAKAMKIAKFATAPLKWPDLAAGKKIFENTCAKCHGVEGRGNGPSAPGLNPAPTNFFDPKMESIAPLQAFNTIRLGVPGTSMAPFATYSDQETWNLAFYVMSLRHGTTRDHMGDDHFQAARSDLKLSFTELLPVVATQSDGQLSQKLTGGDLEKGGKLTALRSKSTTNNVKESLGFAAFRLEESLADYQAGRFEAASRKALQAYLEGVEPVEKRLRADNPETVTNLESDMASVRSAIHDRKPADEVSVAVQKAKRNLSQTAISIQEQTPSPWLTFTLVLGIILREGFEALLIIAALLGVLRASGNPQAARWVHGGWITAGVLGLLAWFFSGWLMGLSGLGREILEGITGALTVLILIYVGFWLHSRTEIGRWKTFIAGSVRKALEGKNLLNLALFSFLAAFREVIETVLFLRAIWLEGGPESKLPFGLGVAASFFLIFLLGWLLLGFSAKIPVKKLFAFSSLVMALLALMLAGKSVHSFQEADLVSVTTSALPFRLDWLGFYPTWEVQAAQAAVLALLIFLWRVGKRPLNGGR